MVSVSTSPDSSRRDFLKGKAGARALRDAVDGALGPAGDASTGWKSIPRPVAEASDYLLSVSRQAMACTFEVHFPAVLRGRGTEAALAALNRIDELEAQMTVYRAASEVLDINRLAAEQPVHVEERLFGLLERAIELSRETAGAFDITSTPLSEIWGFSRRQGRLPSEGEIEAAKRRVGYEQIVLDPSKRTIAFTRPGVAINLNSIGKGYALDRVAELLVESGLERFLLHGGNSSVLGRSGPEDQPAWRIGVRNPLRPTERLGELLVADRAVSTSGSGTQFFHHRGKRYGHLLDPRTGYPAEGVFSATVLAPRGADADALATAFYILGPEKVEEFCRRHEEIGAILVCPGRSGRKVERWTFGAADAYWRPSGAGAGDGPVSR
jgi:FAD:protein FMN transferase